MRLLVTGFGPFGTVEDNPASRLARSLDGVAGHGFSIVGREIPVSYRRAPELTVQLARENGVDHVIGVGVAVSRTTPQLERFGRRGLGATPDVDGVCAPVLPGPERLPASLDVGRWSRALSCETSEDAGGYVCNAWLHQVRQLLPIPVGFLHIPLSGVTPEWFVTGVARLLTSPDAP
jgi:pyroglutamyl-peptidase